MLAMRAGVAPWYSPLRPICLQTRQVTLTGNTGIPIQKLLEDNGSWKLGKMLQWKNTFLLLQPDRYVVLASIKINYIYSSMWTPLQIR